MRRANDISQDAGFVASPQVGAHKDQRFGTHHARDAWHLYQTMGSAYDLNLFSSAMKVNSQLMHIIQYSLKVRKPVTRDELDRALRGRRPHRPDLQDDGQQRLLVRARPRLLRAHPQPVGASRSTRCTSSSDGTQITGYCFTPQDGNSLLSSVAAVVWGLYPETYDKIVQCLKPYFFQEV